MTKLITIDPTEARKSAVLTAPEIPLNAYQSDPAAEAEKIRFRKSGAHISRHGLYP
jgi:hypothetical protein